MISKFKKTKWTSTLLTVILMIMVAAAGLTGCNKKAEVVKDNTSDITPVITPDNTTPDTTDSTEGANGTDGTPKPETTAPETTTPNNATTNPTEGASELTPSEEREAIYYGDWKINKVLAFGSVGTFSREDADALIGKVLSFSANKATNFLDSAASLETVSAEPIYSEAVLTKEDFVTNYRMTFDNLGIGTDEVTEISVMDANGVVCTFLVIDENTLILSGGGTYFELVRE
jgi:hypothetical protein